jgi:subtilase family serine protease
MFLSRYFRKTNSVVKSHRRESKISPAVMMPAVMIEVLELRTLCSAAQSAVAPEAIFLPDSSSSAADIQGYTPAQIRTAYGFTNVSFGTSSVSADGAGQTIAIIDAYNDPNIASDLAVFDSEFGLATANLKVVNQTGGTKLPATNGGWAGEISLDVEWAHAIAPGADILLVEANSENTDDLMAAVDYARTVPSVSVISMSWGGSETADFAGGAESTSQTAYDADFTTPAGHQGITFLAAAGDSGSQAGVEWPASSPNVVAVGGTSLTLDSGGDYESETAWSGTSGGYSTVETEPSYQESAQSTGYRSVPDVAYDADPNTGFAVYDSVPDDGSVGWGEVGGTSAGSPQWGALIAIADQGRVLDGQSTLDGATQTLPDLYALYGTPGTSAYDTYTTYFNNIVTQGNDGNGFGFGHHYHPQGTAGVGYNTLTGLGTPHATDVIDALDGDTSTSSGGSTSGGGSTTTPVSPSTLPASPVSIGFVNSPPTAVIGSTVGTLSVDLTNISDTAFKGPVIITIYASTDGTLSSNDTVVTTLTIKSLSVGELGNKQYKLKFDYPTTLVTGSYDLIAIATATDTDTEPSTAVSATPVTITAPDVQLSASFGTQTAVTVKPGKSTSVVVTIDNLGNVTAVGSLDLSLYASANGLIDTNSTLLNSLSKKKIKIAAGKSIKLTVKFKAPADLTPGDYSLIASIAPTTSISDTDTAEFNATIQTAA